MPNGSTEAVAEAEVVVESSTAEVVSDSTSVGAGSTVAESTVAKKATAAHVEDEEFLDPVELIVWVDAPLGMMLHYYPHCPVVTRAASQVALMLRVRDLFLSAHGLFAKPDIDIDLAAAMVATCAKIWGDQRGIKQKVNAAAESDPDYVKRWEKSWPEATRLNRKAASMPVKDSIATVLESIATRAVQSKNSATIVSALSDQ